MPQRDGSDETNSLADSMLICMVVSEPHVPLRLPTRIVLTDDVTNPFDLLRRREETKTAKNYGKSKDMQDFHRERSSPWVFSLDRARSRHRLGFRRDPGWVAGQLQW